jgi:serine phosphatase RsbU (regulator of sigma subunit)
MNDPADILADLDAAISGDAAARDRVRAALQANDSAAAARVQRGFLTAPPLDVAGYEFFAHYEPARRVGGDHYEFVPLASGCLGVVVMDVAGKGTPAALLKA